jgi:hypothetical protein
MTLAVELILNPFNIKIPINLEEMNFYRGCNNFLVSKKNYVIPYFYSPESFLKRRATLVKSRN